MDVNEERRKKDRERYARMTNEQKHEKLKKRREAYQQKKLEEGKKQSLPNKDSIAIVNPASITPEEVDTSALNDRQRKPVTLGERQTFVHRRNEEFSTKQRKTISLSSQENTSVKNNGNYVRKTPQVQINGNIYYAKTATSPY
jgi:hypothetical protein